MNTRNPNDVIRDKIIRYLYDIHKNSPTINKTWVNEEKLCGALEEEEGIPRQDVTSNLDYLVDKKWVKRHEKKHPSGFETKQGHFMETIHNFKISSNGIDLLEKASTYKRTPVSNSININNIKGVVSFGDGNVINTEYKEADKLLDELQKSVLESDEIEESKRLDVSADIDSIRSQLQKPSPNKSLIKELFNGLRGVLTIAKFSELLQKIATHLG